MINKLQMTIDMALTDNLVRQLDFFVYDPKEAEV